MKAWSGFFELILITVFIIACIPLMMSLIYAMNHSKFNYLDDKTIYSLSMSQDEMFLDSSTGLYYPNAMLPIHTDFGGALALALVQDDYCPDEAKIIAWSYGNEEPNEYLTKIPAIADTGSNPEAPELKNYEWGRLEIHSGWQGIKTDRYYTIKNRVAIGKIPNTYVIGDKPLYLVYNYRDKCWMVTAKRVNVFK